MADLVIISAFLLQAIVTAYALRAKRDQCPLLAGSHTQEQSVEFAKSKSVLASVDFCSADLQILAPNASNLWKPREICLDVTCWCGSCTHHRMTDPFPESADGTLCCGTCGRTWRQLGAVIRERCDEFREYLRTLHERN
jgi:hypothetical protein